MNFERFLSRFNFAALLVLTVLVAVGFYLLEQTRTESRDQLCMWFEPDHLEDVQELRRTYKRVPEALEFYIAAAPEKLRPFLENAVATDVARLEAEARVDSAPAFCDEPGVGLPEPDPVVPKRPKGLLP